MQLSLYNCVWKSLSVIIIRTHLKLKANEWGVLELTAPYFSQSSHRIASIMRCPHAISTNPITTWILLTQFNCGRKRLEGFIGRPCKKRADNLLKLSRPQLRVIVAILTGHAPVQKHLCVMGLFDGDPTCRFCRTEAETVQHIVCCCEALARQRYKVYGRLTADPKDISIASLRDLCLFIRGTR
jgi:hypothetical protein